MRKNLLFIFISLILVLYSCEKDELTEPTSVDLVFSMESYTCCSDGGIKSGSFFDITEGTMIMESIEFDGRRDIGEDYFFTSSFAEPLKAVMHNQNANQNVRYDMPQGVYKRIELIFSLGGNNEDALCLQGSYQRGAIEEIEIRFEYSFKDQIRVRAKNDQNDEQIVLKSNSDIKANVVFDVPHFFQFVNMNMIKNAEVTQLEGEDMILINSTNNVSIFNVLVTKLDNSMRVIFEE